MKDYYGILGVKREATDKEIKKAYRKLARKHHPDVNPEKKGTEARFKEISSAYSVLGDKERREQYDRSGQQAFTSGFDPSGAYARHGTGFGGFKSKFNGFNSGEAYTRGRAGGFEEILGDIFSRRKQARSRRPQNGADVERTLEIDFESAMKGTSFILNLNAERLSVKIPKGVRTGSRIRLVGRGKPAQNRGANGDLYITIKVLPHPFFERQGNDIFLEVPITICEATLGATIAVPTIEGKSTMIIPAGTQGGQKFRFRGKGAPDIKGETRGDQYVITNITVPKDTDEKSKEILEQFSRLNPENPRKAKGW